MPSTGHLVDRLGGVLVRPAQTLRAVAEERHIAAATGLILLTSLRPFFSESTAYSITTASHTPAGEWAIQLLFTGLFLLAVHGIARAYNGVGSLRGLISAYGLAAFPKLLHYPLLLIARSGVPFPIGLASLAITVWTVVLVVLAVRETYQLRTVAAAITCVVAVGALALLVTLLAFGGLLLFGLALFA